MLLLQSSIRKVSLLSERDSGMVRSVSDHGTEDPFNVLLHPGRQLRMADLSLGQPRREVSPRLYGVGPVMQPAFSECSPCPVS